MIPTNVSTADSSRLAAIGAVAVIKNYWSFLSTRLDIKVLQNQNVGYGIDWYVPTADSRLLQEVKTTFSKPGAQQRVQIYLCQSKNIQVYGEQTLNADYHAEKISTQLLANITREKLLGIC
jgi:hypothetical protein